MKNSKLVLSLWVTYILIEILFIYLLYLKFIDIKYMYMLVVLGILYAYTKFYIIDDFRIKDVYIYHVLWNILVYTFYLVSGILSWSILYLILHKFNLLNTCFFNESHFLYISRRMIFISTAIEYMQVTFAAGFQNKWSDIKFTDKILMPNVIFIFIFLIFSLINPFFIITFVNMTLISCMPNEIKVLLLTMINKIKYILSKLTKNQYKPYILKTDEITNIIWDKPFYDEARDKNILEIFIVYSLVFIMKPMLTTNLFICIGSCSLGYILVQNNIHFF